MSGGLTFLLVAALLAAPVSAIFGFLAGAWVAVRVRAGQSPLPQLRRTPEHKPQQEKEQPPRVKMPKVGA